MRKSEKKKLTFYIVIFLLLLFVVEFYIFGYFYRKYYYYNKGKLIAKVGNIKIYDRDISGRLDYLSEIQNKKITLSNIDKEILKAILYEVYIDKILEKEFYNKKFSKDKIDTVINTYKRNLIREEYIKSYVTNNITNKELEQKYENLIKDIKDKEERKISHILVETEEEAERILKSLRRNNNFEYLANKYSIDKASAINGGSLGYLMKNEIESEDFANIIFIMKKGEISKPIQTKYGWHIAKVDDIRKTEIKDFPEVKDNILELLKEDLINEFLIKKTKNINIELIGKK